jgi:hypothetical protein
MSTFGDDLIQAMTEALDHAKGQGHAAVHAPHCSEGSSGTSPSNTGANGSADGHESVGPSEVGTRAASDQRARGGATANHPERA